MEDINPPNNPEDLRGGYFADTELFVMVGLAPGEDKICVGTTRQLTAEELAVLPTEINGQPVEYTVTGKISPADEASI